MAKYSVGQVVSYSHYGEMKRGLITQISEETTEIQYSNGGSRTKKKNSYRINYKLNEDNDDYMHSDLVYEEEIVSGIAVDLESRLKKLSNLADQYQKDANKIREAIAYTLKYHNTWQLKNVEKLYKEELAKIEEVEN